MSSIKTKHPGVAALVAGAVLVVGLLSSPPALALCVPNPFVPAVDWLQAQENAGGHTILNHVGWTNQELIDRYNNSQIRGASTYVDNDTATQHIQAALAIAAAEYNAWEPAAVVGTTHVVTTNMNATVGHGVYLVARPADLADVHNQDQVFTIMKKSAPGTCYLLTSFPVP